MLSLARIKKELKDIQSSESKTSSSNITAELVSSNDFTHWKGTITGPKDTPYETGIFTIDIKIPNDYPFQPPKMKFITKIWHPNISSQTGAICLDVLKDEWSPALTLRTTLLSLQALLSSPNPSDPQDAIVAQQYIKSHSQFIEKAKLWTRKYAHENFFTVEQEQKILQLVEMGFEQNLVKDILKQNNFDVQKAMEKLLQ